MTSEDAVSIPRAEYEALTGVVAAVEAAYRLQTGGGWVEALDGIWTALGAYYRAFPARRPSGVERS